MAQFSQKELDIIYNGTIEEPFRVLTTDNEADSLILRSKSEDIDQIKGNQELLILVQRLLATMEAEQGVGIAAPQVGVLKNVFLFIRTDETDYPVEVAINPKIINHADTTICFENDGCLSIPGRNEDTVRYPWIEIEYTNLVGQNVRERLEGYSRDGNFVSVIFQHEFDHLQGIMYTDRICKEEKTE